MEVKYTVCPHDYHETCAWSVEVNSGMGNGATFFSCLVEVKKAE